MPFQACRGRGGDTTPQLQIYLTNWYTHLFHKTTSQPCPWCSSSSCSGPCVRRGPCLHHQPCAPQTADPGKMPSGTHRDTALGEPPESCGLTPRVQRATSSTRGCLVSLWHRGESLVSDIDKGVDPASGYGWPNGSVQWLRREYDVLDLCIRKN